MVTILTNSGVGFMLSSSLLSCLASWGPAPSHVDNGNSASSSSSFVSKINFSRNVSGNPKKGLHHSKENTFSNPQVSHQQPSPCWLWPRPIFLPSVSPPLHGLLYPSLSMKSGRTITCCSADSFPVQESSRVLAQTMTVPFWE